MNEIMRRGGHANLHRRRSVSGIWQPSIWGGQSRVGSPHIFGSPHFKPIPKLHSHFSIRKRKQSIIAVNLDGKRPSLARWRDRSAVVYRFMLKKLYFFSIGTDTDLYDFDNSRPFNTALLSFSTFAVKAKAKKRANKLTKKY